MEETRVASDPAEEGERASNPVYGGATEKKAKAEGVKLVHLPLDVDSYSLQVADLVAAIEQAWIGKLKMVFTNVFRDEWDERVPDGEDWGEDLDAKWAAELDGGSLAEAPYRVLRLTKAGTELTNEDLQGLDDAQMIFVELERGEKTVGFEMLDKMYTLNCVIERSKVNMFIVPLKMRVPTPKRLLADGDDETLEGGVSVLKICNWDLAIIWNKLEKDPEKADVWAALSERIDARTEDADDDSEQAQGDIIVELFNELMQEGVAELGSDDICDFMDKSRLVEANTKAERWIAKAAWERGPYAHDFSPAEYGQKAQTLLQELEESILHLDKFDSFLASSSKHAEKQIKLYEGKVESVMSKLLAMTPCPIPLNASDVSTFLDEKRLSNIIEMAEAKSKTLGIAANMLDVALVPYEREHYIQQMRGAGLVCVTRTCKTKRTGVMQGLGIGDGDEEIPRMITLVTAPKDRFEYEAENKLQMKKRIQSNNAAIRGPQIDFFASTASDPYPYSPYFESPELGTGTADCVFTHAEREDLIWSIIEGQNEEADDVDDDGKTPFPSQCGADIDFNELVSTSMCERYFSLHHPRALRKLRRKWAIPRKKDTALGHAGEDTLQMWEIFFAKQPLDRIRAYFGERTAWYFVWMGFYTRSLILPSVVGVVVFVLSIVAPQTPTIALYSIFISIWATMYLEGWQRAEVAQAYAWDVDTFKLKETGELSQSFVKQMRRMYMDKSTAKQNLESLQEVLPGIDAQTIQRDIEDFDLWYFPHSKRTWNQYVSVFITSMCLVVVFILALVLFEFEEFVEDTTSRQTAFLIKGIMGGVLIPIINNSYDSVATWLTAREFHPTQEQEDKSVALKKFTFEFINSFITLFWIAFLRGEQFYENDEGVPPQELRMQQLRTELASILITGQIMNLFFEVMTPLWANREAGSIAKAKLELSKKQRRKRKVALGKKTDTALLFDDAERQMLATEWEDNVDEYLEMVIQFGYITMFVSVFPLAPLFALTNNCLELRVDACKLCYFCQKPECHRASGIGVWFSLMQIMSISAVIVNCLLLFSLPGSGVTAIMPDKFLTMISEISTPAAAAAAADDDDDDDDYYDDDDGSGDGQLYEDDYKQTFIVTVCVVALEHAVLLAKMILRALIPNEPSSIADDEFKELYFKRKELAEYYERLERQKESFNVSRGVAPAGFESVIQLEEQEDANDEANSMEASLMQADEDDDEEEEDPNPMTEELEGSKSMRSLVDIEKYRQAAVQ